MANSFGTTAVGKAIVTNALSILVTKRPLLRYVSLDISPEQVPFNTQVIAKADSLPAVSNWGSAAADVTINDVPVTIDQHKQVLITLTKAEYDASGISLIDRQANYMATALNNSLIDAIAALVTNANFSNKTTVAASWTFTNTIRPMRLAMQGRGCPATDRVFVANSNVYDAFLGDSAITTFDFNAQRGNAIAEGVLPNAGGFAFLEYPSLPANGENLVAWAMFRDAIVLASRAPTDPQSFSAAQFPGRYDVITEPTTGLTAVINEWIDPTTRNVNLRVDWQYGIAKGITGNLQRLVTA